MRIHLHGPAGRGGVAAHVDALRPYLPHTAEEADGAAILHLNPSLRHTSLFRTALHLRHARRHHQRVLLHIHGWSPRLAAALTRMGLHDLSWRHTRFFALGHTFRDRLVAMGIPAHRIDVVGPCARSFDLPPRDPDGPLLFLGRLVRAKGVQHLIRAADRPVWIAGTGPDEPRLRRIARHRPVRFLDWRDDIEPLLAACSALVLPSYEEGLPVCVLEALGSRRPVVATDVGAIREVLPSVVPVRDEAALHRAFASLTDVPVDQASAIRERYAPQSVAAACLRAYDQLLAEP